MIDKTYFKNKKILVTGGTGMIGRQLVSKLCDLESEVISNLVSIIDIAAIDK